LAFAASPAVYPPVDRTTGGPTGSSLLGSALIVVNLMVILPRAVAVPIDKTGKPGIWMFLVFSWLFFGVTEWMGGTHFHWYQIVAMGVLLPWAWLLPRDWARFSWPDGSRGWRVAMFAWWGLLVVSGFLMYQPGVLDQIKFTQGLVAHSHLAMAGFTTSFCAMLLVLLTGKRMGADWTVWTWHLAALAMIVTLALVGWREGDGPSWMLEQPAWRSWGFAARAFCGLLMWIVSIRWLIELRKP
jgi:cytochrome c oxidase cbb3-type subunit I